jgi:hypothetical protein
LPTGFSLMQQINIKAVSNRTHAQRERLEDGCEPKCGVEW